MWGWARRASDRVEADRERLAAEPVTIASRLGGGLDRRMRAQAAGVELDPVALDRRLAPGGLRGGRRRRVAERPGGAGRRGSAGGPGSAGRPGRSERPGGTNDPAEAERPVDGA